jgi:membrane protease YdiL (CAAX protease family)
MDESLLSRRRHLAGLIIVGLVAFSFPLFNSTLYFLSGNLDGHSQAVSSGTLTFWASYAAISELVALAVLFYVLSVQGQTLGHLGFGFSWRDVPESFALCIAAYIAVVICHVMIFYGYFFLTRHLIDQTPQNVDFMRGKISAAMVLLICINPFFEELIARAYVITEVKLLTRRSVIAVIASVALQTAYHLYQGIPSALSVAAMFLIFSLYYVKRKRILPVILAHLYFDALALILSAR